LIHSGENGVCRIGDSPDACIAELLDRILSNSNVAVTPDAKREAVEMTSGDDLSVTTSAAAPVEDTGLTQLHQGSACLKNEFALKDYADALAKLWKR
jgi:hypothetical protein